MIANDGTRVIGYFVAGMGIGAIMGILFAPRSRQEMREYLRKRADEGRDPLMRQAKGFGQRAEHAIERGKDYFKRQRDSVGAAIDAGKRVYWEEKQRLQSESRI